MTPIRKKAFIRSVKNISISSAIVFSLMGGGVALQGCGSSENNEDDYSYEEVESYTTGVKMFIEETEKGKYIIKEEVEVPIDSSIAIVKTLDNRELRLKPDEAQRLIDDEIKTNQASIGQSSGLSNVLLYGGMGYLLARTVSPNYGYYRPDMNNGFYGSNRSKADTSRRRRSTFFGRFYGTGARYEEKTALRTNIENSRTTTTRPAGGRSGFFGGKVRSSYSG
jgi:hypothetical protein